jgi:hypothetical protein
MLDKHKNAKAADYERESEKTETYQDTKPKPCAAESGSRGG